MAYITNAEIGNYLHVDLNANGQAAVDKLITGVSAAVDKYCNRTWSKAENDEITERFDGGEQKYFVRTPPISEVVSVRTGLTNSYAGDLLVANNDDYFVYDDHVHIAGRAPYGSRSVEIVYKTSANEAPADVKQACIQWVADMFKASPDAGKRAKKVQMGAVTVEYNVTPDDFPPFVKLVLDKYRLFAL